MRSNFQFLISFASSYCPRFKLQAAVEPVEARDHGARLEYSGLNVASLMPHCPSIQMAGGGAATSDPSIRSSTASLADLDAFSRHSLPHFPFSRASLGRLHGFEWHSRAVDDPEPSDWRHALHVPHVHSTQQVDVSKLVNFAMDYQSPPEDGVSAAEHSHSHQSPKDYVHTVRYAGFPIARIPFELGTQPHYQPFIETSVESDFLFGHVQVALEHIPDPVNKNCVSLV